MKESRYNIWVRAGDQRHVYNGLSGAILAIPERDWPGIDAFIAGDDSGDVDTALLRALVLGRMMTADDTDELAILERRYRASRRNSHALGLTIVTSLGCNFDCPYCFEAKHPSLLDADVQDLLLDLVRTKLPTIRDFTVTWFGGEPLVGLAPLLRLSTEFTSLSAAAGVTYSATVITNGYLLTASTARSLREHGVSAAQVTLDGPPEVHDRMRPLVNGHGTFATVLRNVAAAADILDVSVRVNIDASNVDHYERLLEILAAAGLAGRVSVYPGHILLPDDDPRAPSASYRGECLSPPEFAAVERRFASVASRHGFGGPPLPPPIGAPCTAVREHELVVGSRGELYKCWDSVGNPHEVIGHLSSWRNPNDRLLKWLAYDPFADAECVACPALPVCMGGCAHHAFSEKLRDSRCSTFRFTHHEQVEEFIARGGGFEPGRLVYLTPHAPAFHGR